MGFAERLLARATALRVPALFGRHHPEAVYEVRNRNGLSVLVLPTEALTEDELSAILSFRLAQYVAAGFVDVAALYDRGVDREPLSSIPRTDLHVIAGTARDGELLAYLAVRGVEPSRPEQPLRSHQRRAFPVEELHGMGVYDRLAHLPDLRVAQVREIGRFVKNHRHLADELGVRAPIETLLALIRTMTGPLRSEIEALIGEVEEGVVKRNLDYLDTPTVLVRGTVPCETSSWLCGHTGHTFYPFALSVSDYVEHALPRATAIENALSLPGRQGIRALLDLRRSAAPQRSRFEPPDGLPALTNAEVPHADLAMSVRCELRRQGDRLRRVHPFDRLTSAEATVLRTFMASDERNEGDVVMRPDEDGDALFVVEQGIAEVLSGSDELRSLRLEPGSCFGRSVLGLPETAVVIARTPMRLLRLGGDAYRRYLASMDDLQAAFSSVAAPGGVGA
jgi:hypothetical protein